MEPMEEVRAFLREYYQAYTEERIEHSERVLRICDDIADHLRKEADIDLNRDLLHKAAILHDIAKLDDKDRHHKLAEKVISEHHLSPVPADQRERLGRIIRAHKGDKFKPGWENALLAATLRMADKIDKAVWKEDGKTVPENLDLIHDYFKGKKKDGHALPVGFKLFRQACEAAEKLERGRKEK